MYGGDYTHEKMTKTYEDKSTNVENGFRYR